MVSNADGLYSVPALNPGTYSVKADLAGFAPQVRNNVSLLIGATLTVDLQLGVAGIQENLTVTGQAPLIETTQSIASNSITQTEVQSLPMLNRSMAALISDCPSALGSLNAASIAFGILALLPFARSRYNSANSRRLMIAPNLFTNCL